MAGRLRQQAELGLGGGTRVLALPSLLARRGRAPWIVAPRCSIAKGKHFAGAGDPSHPRGLPLANAVATAMPRGRQQTSSSTPPHRHHSPPAAGTTTCLRFIVPEFITAPGQVVALVGSSAALGNWDASRAVRLVWQDGHRWVAEVHLEAGWNGALEFKLALIDGACAVWEPGRNRLLVVDKAAAAEGPVEVVCCWASCGEVPPAPAMVQPRSYSMPRSASADAGAEVTVLVPLPGIAGHANVGPNARLVLTGGIPQLGDWDPAKGLVLSLQQLSDEGAAAALSQAGFSYQGGADTANQQLWMGKVRLPVSKLIEAKVAVVEDGQPVQWEAGPNRSILLSPSPAGALFHPSSNTDGQAASRPSTSSPADTASNGSGNRDASGNGVHAHAGQAHAATGAGTAAAAEAAGRAAAAAMMDDAVGAVRAAATNGRHTANSKGNGVSATSQSSTGRQDAGQPGPSMRPPPGRGHMRWRGGRGSRNPELAELLGVVDSDDEDSAYGDDGRPRGAGICTAAAAGTGAAPGSTSGGDLDAGGAVKGETIASGPAGASSNGSGKGSCNGDQSGLQQQKQRQRGSSGGHGQDDGVLLMNNILSINRNNLGGSPVAGAVAPAAGSSAAAMAAMVELLPSDMAAPPSPQQMQPKQQQRQQQQSARGRRAPPQQAAAAAPPTEAEGGSGSAAPAAGSAATQGGDFVLLLHWGSPGCSRPLYRPPLAPSPPASASTAATAMTHLTVPVFSAQLGEQLMIAGASAALGAWDPSKGVQLKWGPGHRWTGRIELPLDEAVDFKVVLYSRGQYFWEPGPNRRVDLGQLVSQGSPSGAAEVHLACNWGLGPSTAALVVPIEQPAVVMEVLSPEAGTAAAGQSDACPAGSGPATTVDKVGAASRGQGRSAGANAQQGTTVVLDSVRERDQDGALIKFLSSVLASMGSSGTGGVHAQATSAGGASPGCKNGGRGANGAPAAAQMGAEGAVHAELGLTAALAAKQVELDQLQSRLTEEMAAAAAVAVATAAAEANRHAVALEAAEGDASVARAAAAAAGAAAAAASERQQQHVEQVASLRSDYESRILDLQQQYESRILYLQQHEGRMLQLQQQHTQKLESMEESHQQALAEATAALRQQELAVRRLQQSLQMGARQHEAALRQAHDDTQAASEAATAVHLADLVRLEKGHSRDTSALLSRIRDAEAQGEAALRASEALHDGHVAALVAEHQQALAAAERRTADLKVEAADAAHRHAVALADGVAEREQLRLQLQQVASERDVLASQARERQRQDDAEAADAAAAAAVVAPAARKPVMLRAPGRWWSDSKPPL